MTEKAIAIIQKFVFIFISHFFCKFLSFHVRECVNTGIIETYDSVGVSTSCGDEGEL